MPETPKDPELVEASDIQEMPTMQYTFEIGPIDDQVAISFHNTTDGFDKNDIRAVDAALIMASMYQIGIDAGFSKENLMQFIESMNHENLEQTPTEEGL